MCKFKNLYIPMVFFSFLFGCGSREQGRPQAIGIGLLTVNTSYPIPLYRNQADELPFDTLRFDRSKSGRTVFVSATRLNPYLMSEGDSDQEAKEHVKMGLVRYGPELKFCVVDTGKSYFRVIGNQVSKKAFVIRKDPRAAYYSREKMLEDNKCINCPGSKYNPRWYVFETWERYLKRVEFITKDNLVIYDVPDGRVIFEDSERTFLPFAVAEVRGEWIKLKKGFGRESHFDPGRNYDGWTKWLDGTDILIDITERLYE